jgi:hypothetical protein
MLGRGCGAEAEIELGAALQQPGALTPELRLTLLTMPHTPYCEKMLFYCHTLICVLAGLLKLRKCSNLCNKNKSDHFYNVESGQQI